jgi:flagellar M-ring protein FliF
MAGIRGLLSSLSWKQRITILAAAAAVAGGLWWTVRWNQERDLRPLFTGMAAEDAGAVVERLRGSEVPFRVSGDGGTILVPSARVAELRLEMAAAGLPRTGRIGFELFDKTNFGATEFAEQVNFRRAVEGELERSVMALAEVERARVHVTFPKESIFAEVRQPAKASVLVKLRPGRKLSAQNVMAVTHLAASAVEGLAPEAVSVLDMDGNLLSRARRTLPEEGAAAEALLDYRQGIEKDLLQKVRATLDPLLGPEKYRAGITAECDPTSGEESQETYNPDQSVMVTSQKTEDTTAAAAPAGVPGTASNLPRPPVRPATTASGVNRRTENITYQTSRVVRRTKLPQGKLKRVSVSVLLDQTLRWEGSGPKARRIITPPAPETIKVVKDVVAGVIGFQQERGDQVLVETLPFEATLLAPPPEAPETPRVPPGGALPFQMPGWLGKIPQSILVDVLGGLLLAVLGAAAWLYMRWRRRQAARSVAAARAAHPASLTAGAAPAELPEAESGPSFEQKALAQMAESEAERERLEQEALAALKLPAVTKKAEVLKKHIIENASKDPAAAAQLVRTWLKDLER